MKNQKIVIRITFEVLGSPKDHVEKTLKDYMDKLKAESGVNITDLRIHDAIQQDNKLWSTFSEVELELDDVKKLTDICLDYLPSTLEILEPAGMEIDMDMFSESLNDLLATLHKYTMTIKKLQSENIYMMKKLEGKIE